jgi:hypothetical protein
MEIQSGDFTRVSTGKIRPFCCMAIKYMLQNTLIKLSAAGNQYMLQNTLIKLSYDAVKERKRNV